MDDRRRKNLVYVLLAGVVIFFIIIMLALGGGKGPGGSSMSGGTTGMNGKLDYPPVPVIPVDTVIPKNTHILSVETIQRLESVSSDNRVLTFSGSNQELQGLSAGNVIVGDSSPKFPYGFLRKIIRIDQVGGTTVLDTVNTTLEAAIQDGYLHYKRELTQADLSSAQNLGRGGFKLASPVRNADGFVVQMKDIVVYDDDNDLSTTDDQVKASGEFTFKPELTFDLSIKSSKIQELLFEVGCTTKNQISLSTSTEIKSFSKTRELDRWTMRPITVMVGPVPIVLVPVIILNMGVDGSLSVGLETSVSHEVFVSAGLKYTDNQWQPFANFTNQVNFNFPPALYGELDAKAYIVEQTDLLLYGIVGPYSSLKGGVEGEIKLTVIQPGMSISNNGISGRVLPEHPLEWATYLFITDSVGIRFDVLSDKLPQKEMDVITFRTLLDKGTIGGGIEVTPTSQSVSQPTISTKTNTVLLFDTSGSMEDPTIGSSTKLNAAVASGWNIINMIQAENQSAGSNQHSMGIAHFGTTAGVDSAISNDFNALSGSLSGLSPEGATAMADGLQAALSLFSQGASGTKNILVLLSDGIPNRGLGGIMNLDSTVIREEILNLSSEAGNRGICIYTVGFGEPGKITNNGPSIDEDLLKEVANRSGCGSYSSAENSMQLANVYVSLRHQSTGEVVLQKTGRISQGEKAKIGNFQVENGQDQLYLSLNWPGSQLDVVLVDPQGRQVDNQYSGASLSATKTLDTILINNPMVGQWSFQALGVDVPEGITDYNAIVSLRRGSTPAQIPTSPPNSGFAIFLVLIMVIGGGVGVYVLIKKKSKDKNHPPILQFGSTEGQSVIVAHDHFTIGRDSSSDLALRERSVSRNHAMLRYSQGAWYIQDLESKAGTYVNGQSIQGIRLSHGDQITIGKTILVFLDK